MVFNKLLYTQIATLKKLSIHDVSDELRKAGYSEGYITQILDELRAAQSYLQYLEQSYTSDQELEEELRYFFKIRWAAIKQTSAAYIESPLSPINKICEQLAIAIAKNDESIVEILMPTVRVKYYQTLEESLISLTENSDRSLAYHKFILSADEQSIIPIREWLDRHDISDNNPYLFHTYRTHPDGSHKMDENRWDNPGYCAEFVSTPLMAQDLENLKSISQAMKNYIEGIFQWKTKSAGSFTPVIQKLCQDCLDNGVSSHKQNERGKATEAKPHPDVYPLIRDFFKKWFALSKEVRETIAELKERDRQTTLGDIFLVLRSSTAESEGEQDPQNTIPCLTEAEENKRIANNLHTCVEVNANAITRILNTNSVQLAPLVAAAKKLPEQPTYNATRYINHRQLLENNVSVYASCLRKEKINKNPEKFNLYYRAGVIKEHMSELLEDKEFALKCAVFQEDIELINALVQAGADVSENKELLFFAVSKSNVDLILTLISNGININQDVNNNGSTLLHIACERGWNTVVDACLARDHEINKQNKLGSTALYNAVLYGHENIVDKLIQEGANIHIRNNKNFTPLHSAANHGQLVITQRLLRAGADVNAKVSPRNFTPLHLAVESGHTSIVQELLQDTNCDVNSRFGNQLVHNNRWVDDYTVLHLSALLGHGEILALLLGSRKIADINPKNSENQTPFYLAFMHRHIDVMVQLILAGADFSSVFNEEDYLLEWAVKFNYRTIISAIVNKSDSKRRGFLLIRACENDWDYVATCCLSKEHDLNPEYLRLLLTRVVGSQYMDIATALVKADVSFSGDFFRFFHKKPLLMWAVLDEKKELALALVQKGADVKMVCDYKNHGSIPFFHMFCAQGWNEVVNEVLSSNKEMINLKTNNNETALHFAAYHNHLEIMDQLMGLIDLNAKNHKQETALHLAVAQGNHQVVNLLLLNDAIFDGKNSSGKTPLCIAINNGKHEIVRVMVLKMSFETLFHHPQLNIINKIISAEDLQLAVKNDARHYALLLAKAELLNLNAKWYKSTVTIQRIEALERQIRNFQKENPVNKPVIASQEAEASSSNTSKPSSGLNSSHNL